MSTRLNPRIAGMPVSATLAINLRAKELRAAGREIAHFGFGESPFPIHPKLRTALCEHADKNSYLPVLGLPALRKAIAEFLPAGNGCELHADRIAIAPGSKQIIFHLLHILEAKTVLPSPSWVSYAPQAHMLGREVVPVETSCEQGYQITARALDCALAKAGAGAVLILNSPGNPTGQVLSEGELDELAEVCRKHDACVISDEIYAPLDFTRTVSPSIGSRCPERTIVTGGLSKAYSAGGWRLGFAAACSPVLQPVFDALEALVSETYSCVSAPVQHAACTAYSGDEEIQRHVRDCALLHGFAASLTRDRLLQAGLRCAPAGGGFYLFPNFGGHAGALGRKGISTSRKLAETLLEKCGVSSLPSEDFRLAPAELALRMSPVDYDGGEVLRIYTENGRDMSVIEKDANRLYRSMLAGCSRLQMWLEGLQ